MNCYLINNFSNLISLISIVKLHFNLLLDLVRVEKKKKKLNYFFLKSYHFVNVSTVI